MIRGRENLIAAYSGYGNNIALTLLAVAFLLDAESFCGNEPIDGWIAMGLGDVLRSCARKLRLFYQSKNLNIELGNNGELAPVDGQNGVEDGGNHVER